MSTVNEAVSLVRDKGLDDGAGMHVARAGLRTEEGVRLRKTKRKYE